MVVGGCCCGIGGCAVVELSFGLLSCWVLVWELVAASCLVGWYFAWWWFDGCGSRLGSDGLRFGSVGFG